MFPEFNLDPPRPPAEAGAAKSVSPTDEKQFEELWSRLLKPEEQDRLTALMPSGWAALLYLYDLR